MTYKDKEAQREYQREWIRNRRIKWLSENGPCIDCESWDDLEIDHVDASKKDRSISCIWSLSEKRRSVELAKCVVRCRDCHLLKTVSNKERASGIANGFAVLSVEQVKQIRARVSSGEKQADLAREFDVGKWHVYDLVHYRTRYYE
jgi:hypothetical protein